MLINKEERYCAKIIQYVDEVDERNRKNFVSLGFGGVLITGTILAVGSILSRYTEFVLEYGVFFVYMLALYMLAKICHRKKVKHIRLIYYLSITPILLGGIMMGTFLDPKEPAITIMILLCVMTLFIIDKPLRIFFYLLAIASIFTVCCYYAKTYELFCGDMIDLLIYFCISIGIVYFSLKDRIDSVVNYCLVQRKSEQDTLTNLLNRGSGEEQARRLVEHQISGTFAILDIDNFKSFNDNYGHQVGDEVICLLAEQLRATFRTQDIIFRLGGDEFAVYAPGLTKRHLCEEHFERLRKNLREVSKQGTRDLSIEISIGCTIYQSGDIDFESLYKKSDELLYEAKKNGKGQIVIDNF